MQLLSPSECSSCFLYHVATHNNPCPVCVAQTRAVEPERLQLSLESVDEIIALVEGFAVRIGIVPAVVEWMRTFLRASRGGLLDYEPTTEPVSNALEQLRLLNALYKDSFIVTTPPFAERVRGIVTVARVMVEAGPVTLELFLKFFDADRCMPPETDFGQSTGLTTGDLTSLCSMLTAPMTSSFAALAIVHAVQLYIRDVADKSAATVRDFDFPFWPAHLRPTRDAALPQPFTNKTSLVVKTLAELDSFMMLCLRDNIDQSTYALLHVENVVSSTTFQRFREFAKTLFESADVQSGTVLPLVAWHGTPSQDNVDSIIESGILGAGDMTEGGDVIQVAHGSVWGRGIYLSPHMSVADSYATRYEDGTGQMFLSLVLLGRPSALVHSSERHTQLSLWCSC